MSTDRAAQYRFIFEASRSGLAMVGLDGYPEHCNPALERILGYTEAELRTVPLLGAPISEDAEGESSLFQDLVHGRRDRYEIDKSYLHKDGRVVWARLAAAAMRHSDGTPQCIVCRVEDVTEERDARIATEEQLRLALSQFHEAQKMEAMGRLAGGVAHDFNNLLTAISGYGEFVIDKLDANDPRRTDVQEILNAAERATSLTRQLLAFSRKQVLAPKIINPNVVVAGMEKMLRRIIGSDIEMRVTLDPGTGAVRVDPSQLEQVILNLAVNARDAMPNGGVLTVETSAVAFDEPFHEFGIDLAPGRYAMLAVGDTGIGMTQETKARLFEPFFTTKEAGRGTGLGLSTVLGIVHQSGGAIWVESALGQGAVFKVYLPWVGDQAEPAAPVWSESTSVNGHEVVFLVDDDVHVRALGERALQAHGYRVFAFESGPEALEFLAAEGSIRPNVLITDIVMPKMSGLEVANKMREIVPGITVLYITGYTDRAIERGGTANVLQKPFTPSVLLRTVRDLLDRWLRD